jgi:NAD+ synthase
LQSLPPEPSPKVFDLDTDAVVDHLAGFIREKVVAAGRTGVVLGLSGGLDSSLVAHLAARALGPENVHGYILPYRTSSPESLAHAMLEADRLGIRHETLEISKPADALFETMPDMDPRRRGNVMARLRMVVLYDRSEARRALPIGTSNRTERLLGYGTLHGDTAWAFNPIGELYKSQVRRLAAALGVEEAILRKAPSADLWAGQTDESELGVTYEVADRVLYLLVDRGLDRDQVVSLGYSSAAVGRVVALMAASEFKRNLPPVAELRPKR